MAAALVVVAAEVLGCAEGECEGSSDGDKIDFKSIVPSRELFKPLMSPFAYIVLQTSFSCN